MDIKISRKIARPIIPNAASQQYICYNSLLNSQMLQRQLLLSQYSTRYQLFEKNRYPMSNNKFLAMKENYLKTVFFNFGKISICYRQDKFIFNGRGAKYKY